MPGSRESSVWRTLAVAFGDGLAFGVGLTLTNNATRAATAKTPQPYPDIRPLAERITEIEQRIDRVRVAAPVPAAAVNGPTIAKVAEAVLTAMDGRFGEIGEQMERRLAELEVKFKSELAAAEARTQARADSMEGSAAARLDALRGEFSGALEAQRMRMDSDLRVLRSQIMEVHKEFAETLARLVDQQIEQTITLRLQAIHEQMRETVREESLSVYAKFGEGVEAVVDARLQPAQRPPDSGTGRAAGNSRAQSSGPGDRFGPELPADRGTDDAGQACGEWRRRGIEFGDAHRGGGYLRSAGVRAAGGAAAVLADSGGELFFDGDYGAARAALSGGVNRGVGLKPHKRSLPYFYCVNKLNTQTTTCWAARELLHEESCDLYA